MVRPLVVCMTAIRCLLAGKTANHGSDHAGKFREKCPENRKAKRQGDNCLIGFVPTARGGNLLRVINARLGSAQLAAGATFVASIRNRVVYKNPAIIQCVAVSRRTHSARRGSSVRIRLGRHWTAEIPVLRDASAVSYRGGGRLPAARPASCGGQPERGKLASTIQGTQRQLRVVMLRLPCVVHANPDLGTSSPTPPVAFPGRDW